MDNKMNRRGFFSSAAKIAGATFVAPALLNAVLGQSAQAQEKRRGATPPAAGGAGGCSAPLVDPNDPVAKAVKYVEDYKKVPEAKGNSCANCGFYNMAKKPEEMCKGKKSSTCTIFAGKLVLADAYCASWNKKA